MNKEKIVVRDCFKVSKSKGEWAKRWLISNNNLDRDYRVGSDENHLYFPVKDSSAIIASHPADQSNEFRLVKFPVNLQPRKSSYKKILKQKLPNNVHKLIPSSFDLIGNIAIVKIESLLQNHKEDIGEAIISTTSAITVYSKAGDVSGVHRVPILELIAGEDIETAIHKEYSVKMVVNVKKAFFNPRLGNEHRRVAEQVELGELIIDFFTGVGSFALIITKFKEATVYAVDINPSAINCLNESMKINKLIGEIIGITGNIEEVENSLPPADRIIMNLPGGAFKYLNIAMRKIKNGGTIHFYSFSSKNSPDPLVEVRQTVEEIMKDHGFDGKIINSFILREVSIAKFQVVIDIKKNL